MSSPILSSSAPVECYWYQLNNEDAEHYSELALRYLTDEEIVRAARFKVASAKQLFLAGRILLRFLLSKQLGLPAQSIPIQISAKGKPFLETSNKPLYFNISHSHQALVLALSRHGKIGVDIEADREQINIQGLAERILCEQELRSFKALSETRQRAAFFRYWVLKESFVKMKGDGISYGLGKIHFDETCGLLLAPEDVSASIFLNPPEGHYAALCLDQAKAEFIVLRSTQVHSLSEYLNAPDEWSG